MPAACIADIDVADPPAFEEYRKAVPATVETDGGKFLVRGGRLEVVEGRWRPKRVVVTECPSLEQAKHWDDSEAYRALKALRLRTSQGDVILVEGV
jgi:uncharacterized protein (DUF1330 family)